MRKLRSIHSFSVLISTVRFPRINRALPVPGSILSVRVPVWPLQQAVGAVEHHDEERIRINRDSPVTQILIEIGGIVEHIMTPVH